MPITYDQIVEVGRKMKWGDVEYCLTEFIYDSERLAQLTCDIAAARVGSDGIVEVRQDFDTVMLFCCPK